MNTALANYDNDYAVGHYRTAPPRRPRLLLLSTLATFVILTVWAAYAEVDQSTRAPAQIIASSRSQFVQATGDGVLAELRVKEGDSVKAGQVLAVLEKERAVASNSDSLAKVAALRAAVVRLQAEVYAQPLTFDAALKRYPEFVKNQTQLYQRRKQAVSEELASINSALKLAREELAMNEVLLKAGDISRVDLLHLQRQVFELEGKVAWTRNKFMQDAQAELTKVREDLFTQEQVLSERSNLLAHTELRAPRDGIVKNIRVNTVGGVLRAGEAVMEVLPTDSELIAEVKVAPADIGFLRVGLPATLKLDAYDYSIYGSLAGEVIYISSDTLTEDTRNGPAPYYRINVRIGKPDANNPRANEIKITPGMTASVDIRSASRSVLNYLLKPVHKTLDESLKER
jgi:adhesin transport system membrane fusion protein